MRAENIFKKKGLSPRPIVQLSMDCQKHHLPAITVKSTSHTLGSGYILLVYYFTPHVVCSGGQFSVSFKATLSFCD